VNKFILISYTILEKFKKLKISTHICLRNNQNWQLFFTISSYRIWGLEDLDPKLIISDPDPQIENQEFRIRILLWTSDGKKKFKFLENYKTQMA